MRIRLGSTRLVLLTKDKAIKIGRLRLLRLCLRIPIILLSQRRRHHFLSKYGPGVLQAALHDLFAGLYANRNEYAYYRAHEQDRRIMPTTRRLLDGWIILQLRGVPVSASELSEGPVLLNDTGTVDGEARSEKQFCRHPDGRIVLIDYGSDITTKALLYSPH